MSTTKEKNHKQKHLDKMNVKETTKEITNQKDLKYKYPEDATTLEERKKFRSEVRRKLKSYNSQIEELSDSIEKKDRLKAKELKEEMEEYMEDVLVS
jgi:hypothetical protein